MISGCQGLGGGRAKQQRGGGGTQEIFKAMKLFSMILYDVRRLLHLSKPIECTNPRVNLIINCNLWLIIRCQCRLINCNKCTPPVENIDVGEAMHATCGAEDIWENFVLLLNLAMTLQLLQKNCLSKNSK